MSSRYMFALAVMAVLLFLGALSDHAQNRQITALEAQIAALLETAD